MLPFCLLGWGLANIAVALVHDGDSSVASAGGLPAGLFSTMLESALLAFVPLLWLRLCNLVVTERDVVLAESIIR
eukprot:scaffold365608_cov36-Prasinocladus_malaysianus.AAC.1